MFSLKPRNKYAWIKTIDEANKVGNLFVPGNVTNSYRLATIKAIDEDAEEARGFRVGDVVLCDMVGVVSHRIGNQTLETCLIRNFLAVVVPEAEVAVSFDQKDMDSRRVPRDHADVVDPLIGKHSFKGEL
jgi:hypothetical protein